MDWMKVSGKLMLLAWKQRLEWHQGIKITHGLPSFIFLNIIYGTKYLPMEQINNKN